MQTLGQFSHAAMIEEIKKAVREEVMKELAGVRMEAGSAAVHPSEHTELSEKSVQPVEGTAAEEDSGMSGLHEESTAASPAAEDTREPKKSKAAEEDQDMSDIHEKNAGVSSKAEDSDETEENWEMEEDEQLWMLDDEPTSEHNAETVDFMSILMKQAEEMKDISSIEMMDIYDEKVIDITLEDLVSYIQNRK